MTENTDLSAEQAHWLNKYVRESWYYKDGKVKVIGNVTITDKEMTELPFEFATVKGIFKCKGCSSLKSLKGFPTDAEEIVFENCLFPSEFYLSALSQKIELSTFIDKNYHRLSTNDDHLALISEHFPAIFESRIGGPFRN